MQMEAKYLGRIVCTTFEFIESADSEKGAIYEV